MRGKREFNGEAGSAGKGHLSLCKFGSKKISAGLKLAFKERISLG